MSSSRQEPTALSRFGADEDFIKAYYEAAADKYGSIDGLIREGLGLSDRDREELKEMYLL